MSPSMVRGMSPVMSVPTLRPGAIRQVSQFLNHWTVMCANEYV